MAKKNLKRGLALGALMAFVITGSAMAEYVRVSGSVQLDDKHQYKDDFVYVSGEGAELKGDNLTFNFDFDKPGDSGIISD